MLYTPIIFCILKYFLSVESLFLGSLVVSTMSAESMERLYFTFQLINKINAIIKNGKYSESKNAIIMK